jgi:hypothetical protein
VRNPFFFDILYCPREAAKNIRLGLVNRFLIFVKHGKLPESGRISSEMASDTNKSGAIQPQAVTAQLKEG